MPLILFEHRGAFAKAIHAWTKHCSAKVGSDHTDSLAHCSSILIDAWSKMSCLLMLVEVTAMQLVSLIMDVNDS